MPVRVKQYERGDGTWQNTKDKSLQKYYGRFLYNNLHNEGIYTQTSPNNKNYMYEGSFYANNYEGYARVTCSNCTYFEGLFKNNRRFGPGVLTYENGSQDVGLWDGFSLMRLSQIVMREWVPSLARTPVGKAKLLKYRYAIPLNNKAATTGETIASQLNFPGDLPASILYNKNIRDANSIYFDKNRYDMNYFTKSDCMIEVALTHEDTLKEVQGNEFDLISSEFVAQHAIETMFTNMDLLIHCSQKELDLITFKSCVLQMLVRRGSKSIQDDVKMPTKMVKVDHLLTWNNSQISIDFLKYAFDHRNRENIVNFSVNKLLVGDRETFEKAGVYECACAAFLSACSRGNESEIQRFSMEFHINPDLADARGNTGVIFGAARDRVAVIRILAQLGANLDAVNDEGLNPLTLCILRYLATSRGLLNWEQSFLSNDDSGDQEEILTWCPRASFINLLSNNSCFETITNASSIYFKDNYKLMLHYLKCLEENTMDLSAVYEELSLVKPGNSKQDFQEVYNKEADGMESFVFDLNLIKSVVQKVKDVHGKSNYTSTKIKTKTPSIKSSKVANEDENVVDNQLVVILNTIRILLYYGADVNIGEVPMPAIMLALFTENAELLKIIFDSGARSDTQFDNLTSLHILVSLPPSENLVKLGQILIDHHVDLNARTSASHWQTEKKSIIGKYSSIEVQDEGKTALHILGMRYDFILDPYGYLNDLAQLLITNKASTTLKYLGHTPLSLAVLRGNNPLVRTLLNAGADPNDQLGETMGNVLTIYILKRYANYLPTEEKCMEIVDSIIEFYGNPLLPVANNSNAVEFMLNEHPAQKVNKNFKKIQHKKSVRTQVLICKYLKSTTRNVAFKHYQSHALIYLMQSIMNNTTDGDELSLTLVKFFTTDDVLRIVQILIYYNLFNIEDEPNKIIILNLLEFTQINGHKHNSKKVAIQTPLDLISILHPPLKRLKLSEAKEFELDSNSEMYKICFQCCLRENKILLPCPKCGLVYYCSERCNTMNNKMKNHLHPCKALFYNDELIKYKQFLKDGVAYIEGAVARIGKYDNIRVAAKNLAGYIKPYIKESSHYDELLQKYGKNLRSRTGDRSMDVSNDRHVGRSGKCSKRSSKSSKRRDEKSGISKRSRSKDSGEITSRKKDKGYGDTGSEKADTYEVNKGKRLLTGSGIDKKDASSKYQGGTKASQEGCGNHDPSFGKRVVFPSKYQIFLQKVAELFPDFNLSALFMPFICFTNGELYYKFYDDKPIYCPTYSNI